MRDLNRKIQRAGFGDPFEVEQPLPLPARHKPGQEVRVTTCPLDGSVKLVNGLMALSAKKDLACPRARVAGSWKEALGFPGSSLFIVQGG
jgi:hypothetical protein